MKKYVTLFFLIVMAGLAHSQVKSEIDTMELLTLPKDFVSVYAVSSTAKIIAGKPYTSIDTSYFIDRGEKTLAVETFENGFKTEVKTYYDNGKQRCHFQFKRGIPDGISREWYKNGQIKSDDKMKDGRYDMDIRVSYYENGNIKAIFDNKNGVTMGFYESGRTRSIVKNLMDSVKCGGLYGYEEQQLYENGQLRFKIISNCGKQIYRIYYNDSTVLSEETIIDMPLYHVGKCTRWYKDGTKEMEGQYQDGNTRGEANIKTGVWKYWDEKNNLIREEFYENDELKKAKNYTKGKDH